MAFAFIGQIKGVVTNINNPVVILRYKLATSRLTKGIFTYDLTTKYSRKKDKILTSFEIIDHCSIWFAYAKSNCKEGLLVSPPYNCACY